MGVTIVDVVACGVMMVMEAMKGGDGGRMKVVFEVIRYRVGGGGDWG